MNNFKEILLGLLFICPWILSAQTPAEDQNWNITTLKFNDDFTTFDGTKWIKQFPWGTTDPSWKVNFTPAQVTNQQVTEPSGQVTNYLELKAEIYPSDVTKPIHSGTVTATTKMLYGYFEIRARIRATAGYQYNSAFWLWDSYNCDCPSSCPGWYDEIDFIEALPRGTYSGGSYEYMEFQRNTNVRVGTCSGETDHITPHFSIAESQNFHVYGFEWTPNNVICYRDGVPYSYLYKTILPTHPMNMMLQLGFSDNGVYYTDPANHMVFPNYMDIDYVKVYDLDKGDFINYSVTSFNPDTYNYTVKNTITIGGGTTTIVSGKNVTLRAENDMTINGEFTVDNGAEFTMLPTVHY